MAGLEPTSRVFKCVIPSSTEALPLSYITIWLEQKDSNLRNAGSKFLCLTSLAMFQFGCGAQESNLVSSGYGPDMVCPCHSPAILVLPRRLELLLDPYKGSVLTFRRQEVGGSYSRTLPNEIVSGVQFQSHASAVDFTTLFKTLKCGTAPPLPRLEYHCHVNC